MDVKERKENYVSYGEAQYILWITQLYRHLHVPKITDKRKYFDTEKMLIILRIEDKRLQSFHISKYPFPLSDDLCTKLACDGFYYLLIHTFIQCVFCRVIIGNIPEEINIRDEHYRFSPNCRFISGQNVGNIKEQPKILASIKTDIFEIQCKICLNFQINVIFKCGHSFCDECANKLKKCAICSTLLSGKRKIYLC